MWRTMPRVVLIHWKPEEADEPLDRLAKAGFVAELAPQRPGPEMRQILDNRPDVIVIDLSRNPSQGRDFGGALRRRKSTRSVPIVYAGGTPEAIERTKAVLPDASFAEWSRIGPAVKRALLAPPKQPVVPNAMAGYSGTPLPKKLGIKPDTTVVMLGAPAGFESKLEPLPAGVKLRRRAVIADRVLLFLDSAAKLEAKFEEAAALVREGGALWLVWPKKTSNRKSDLGEAAVRKYGLDAGWVDYKICAVDETWSGLQFARRARIAQVAK
jgi:hypothetical protein